MLDNPVLAAEDNTHAAEVADLRAAHYKRVDVEPTPSENVRYMREDTGLILNKAVEDVSDSEMSLGCSEGVRYMRRRTF